MGYVAAFRKDDMRPPVAVVVTQKAVDVLLFPFIKDSQRLLTAAHLSFQLWETPMLAERNCLRLLSCLFYAELMDYKIEYPAAESHEEMRKVVAVFTVADINLQKIGKLEEHLERERELNALKVKEFKELKEENEDLRRQLLSVTRQGKKE